MNNLVQIEAEHALQSYALSELQDEALEKDAQIIKLRAEVERLRDAIGHLHFDKPPDAYEQAIRIQDGKTTNMTVSSLVTQLWYCRYIARTVLKT